MNKEIQVNKMEKVKINDLKWVNPDTGKTVKEAKPKTEWKRTTFDFFDGKAWCYKKMEVFKCEEWSKEELRARGYYCYNCKNELIFKWKDESWRDAEPFKFHKLLVKVLEKKDDDWRTGRKTHTYYAFCCKCAIKDKSDETIKKRFGKVMEFEIDNCDCATFIEEKKREATNSIKSYESMITDCRWLETQLEGLKRIFNLEKNDFKERRLDDFIQQLEKRRSDAINSKKREEDYLNTYNEWETKLNQQIKENEPK